MVENLVQQLSRPILITRFSALDRFYRLKGPNSWSPYLHAAYMGSLVDLARDLPNLAFPGFDGVDAAVQWENTTVHMTILDEEKPPKHPIDSLNLTYQPEDNRYNDPKDSYFFLRRGELTLAGEPIEHHISELSARELIDLTILLARYPLSTESDGWTKILSDPEPRSLEWPHLSSDELRWLWGLVITGRYAHRALGLLNQLGFMSHFWPFLDAMDRTSHSKECHPEGNVWEHSLEALRHRKIFDLAFSTALFLHDCGKPYATRNKNRLFDGHAEIGADLAAGLLKDLGFSTGLTQEITWLIRSHMIPGAIKSLPGYRTEPYMSNPYFPKLLELYRCDLASTWRDLGGYHHVCAAYKGFLRYKKNPFRDSEGKKLLRLYLPQE